MDKKENKQKTESRKKPAHSARRWKRRRADDYKQGDFFVLPSDMTDDEAPLHVVEPPKETKPDNVVTLEELAARQQAMRDSPLPPDEAAPPPPQAKPDAPGGEEVFATAGESSSVGEEAFAQAGEPSPIREEESPPAGEAPPIREEENTRIVEDPPARKAAPPPRDEVEGQIKLEDWDKVPEKPQEGWKDRLRRNRQEQIENFERRREQAKGLDLSGEEAPLPPQPPAGDDSPKELEDYSRYEETAAVQSELLYRRRTGGIVLLVSAVAELLLVWLSFITILFYDVSLLHILLSLALLVVMAAANFRTLFSGWRNLLRLAADADTPVAVATTVTVIHTATQMFNLQAMNLPDSAPLLLPAVAGLGLLLNAAGKQWRVRRVLNNFRLVSYEGEKVAACRVEDPQEAMEIGRPAVAMGLPEVCYFKKSHFLTGFLRHSYGEDAGDERMRLYVPCSLAASLVLAVVFFFVRSADIFSAFEVFTAAVCVSAPLGLLTAVNFPLWRISRRLVDQGAMVSGWDAVEEFGGVHALAVDAMDLFPQDCVLLHGIKTFSGTRIDRAIMDAASVSITAGGPLANVFRRVIEDNEKILQPVESLVYEQDMGLSGWVDGRRVLVGNRRLLENHGVDVPSRDYELRHTQQGQELVYLSTGGQLSAMFVVSYQADEEIEASLQALTREGITLLIRTCDPNVTEDLVCRVYNLDRYYVEVLDAAAGRLYVRLLSEEYADREALVGSNGQVRGTALALACCHRLRVGGRLAVAAQLIGSVLGFALTVFFSFYNNTPAPAFYTVVYMLAVTAVSWLLPLFKRT